MFVAGRPRRKIYCMECGGPTVGFYNDRGSTFWHYKGCPNLLKMNGLEFSFNCDLFLDFSFSPEYLYIQRRIDEMNSEKEIFMSGKYRCADPECDSPNIYFQARSQKFLCRSCGCQWSKQGMEEARLKRQKNKITIEPSPIKKRSR